MHLEALEKVLDIAQKNPKILLSSVFFEKISARLEIATKKDKHLMMFFYNERQAQTVIIDSVNCHQFKCFLKEGKDGVMIYEFINVLVKLLTDDEIPPSPYDKLGATAIYYCERGINILQKKYFAKEY